MMNPIQPGKVLILLPGQEISSFRLVLNYFFMQFGDSYTCSYCLQVIKWDHHRTRPTKDHFFPKSKKKLLMGAKTTFIICCQPCNSRKSDKVFSSVEEVREFITSRKKTLRTNIDGN